MRSLSSNIVIVTGFSLILILLSFLSLLAMYSIAGNSRSLGETVEMQDKMADIFTMRDIAHQRVLLLYTMLSTDDEFEREELYIRYLDQADIFMQARDRFRSHSEEESIGAVYVDAWERVSPVVSTSAVRQNQAIDLILDQQTEQALSLLSEQVIPAQDEVIAALTQLLETHYLVISKQLKTSQDTNNNYLFFIVVLGVIILLSGILITYKVTRYNTGIENELIRQHHAAQQASIAKTDFLANMSHEIRTPLASIIGFSEALLNNEHNEKQQKTVTETIIRNGRHLQQIINDILDISKIEAGQLVIESILTSPFQILDEINSLIGPKAEEKGLKFVINHHFPLPETILTDPTRLKQILINLSSNAIKFTHDGQIAIDVSYDNDYRQIKFVVIDTGIGMTYEETTHIFNQFTQADSTTTRKYGGTGLGLSISSKLARELNGSLLCNSYKDRGTYFTLTLPIKNTKELTLVNQLEDVRISADEQVQKIDVRQLNGDILLVEDTPDNQQLVAMYINQTGAKLTIVENGQQAIDACKFGNYDLILMDMQMPVMDGAEATRLLRENGYSKPIVSLTANATISNREQCLTAGADGYLVKPLDTQLFYEALNRYLPAANQPDSDAGTRNRTFQELNENLKDNPKYQAMVARFVSGLPAMIEKISDSIYRQEWDISKSLTHDLKGMGGSMGFPQITDISAQLNTQLKNKEYENAAATCRELESVCAEIKEQNSAA